MFPPNLTVNVEMNERPPWGRLWLFRSGKPVHVHVPHHLGVGHRQTGFSVGLQRPHRTIRTACHVDWDFGFGGGVGWGFTVWQPPHMLLPCPDTEVLPGEKEKEETSSDRAVIVIKYRNDSFLSNKAGKQVQNPSKPRADDSPAQNHSLCWWDLWIRVVLWNHLHVFSWVQRFHVPVLGLKKTSLPLQRLL